MAPPSPFSPSNTMPRRITMSIDEMIAETPTTITTTTTTTTTLPTTTPAPNYHHLSIRHLLQLCASRNIVPSFKDSLIILLMTDDENKRKAREGIANEPGTLGHAIQAAGEHQGGRPVSPELGSVDVEMDDARQAAFERMRVEAESYLSRQASDHLDQKLPGRSSNHGKQSK